MENVRQDPNWAFKKEITGGTLRNSVKTIKTFCEVTDVLIPWKKITKELPRVKKVLQANNTRLYLHS